MTFKFFGNKDYSDILQLAKNTSNNMWQKRCSAFDEWIKPSRTNYEQSLHKYYNPSNSTYYTLSVEVDREAFDLVQIDTDRCNAVVLKSAPGNIEAPHYDLYRSLLGRDKTLEELKKDLDKVRRVWIPLQPWVVGQILFSTYETLTNWNEFDIFEIPNNTLHGYVNASDKVRYTLVLTGLKTS